MFRFITLAFMLAGFGTSPVGADDRGLAEFRMAVDDAQRHLDGVVRRLEVVLAELDAEPGQATPAEVGAGARPRRPTEAGGTQLPAPVEVPGTVVRHQFASRVVVREPVDRLESLPADAGRVFFFTELRGLEGQRVVHRWIYGGTVMAEVAFEVRGPRWRVFSSKRLLPEWVGPWMVEVVDGMGRVLVRDTLEVEPPREIRNARR